MPPRVRLPSSADVGDPDPDKAKIIKLGPAEVLTS
jgi:hypothetical protein